MICAAILKGLVIVLYRARSIAGTVVFLVILLAILTGCDEVERHKVLTFFFEGVPPLEGEVVEEPVVVDVNVPQRHRASEEVWFIHEPVKNCVQCHGERDRSSFSREVQLTAKVPQLCYRCHDASTPTKSDDMIHGPVAVGECLFCHDPHRTKNRYLLKAAIPKLCYGCHGMAVIESIDKHSDESYSQCNRCHEAHISSEDHLLKTGWQDKVSTTMEPEGVGGQSEQ